MSMSLRKIEAAGDKGGRLKHGVYAYLDKGKLPSGRAWLRVQAEISSLRKALIEEYGGVEKIQPSVLCLIESAIEGLTIQKLSTMYVKKAGILRQDSLKHGDLALHSVLSGQFISYANLVRLNIEAAARLADRKAPEGEPDVLTFVAEFDREKAEQEAREAAKRPGAPQAGQTPENSPDNNTTDKADDAPGGDNSNLGGNG